jgi:hypothetical protein
MTAQKFAQSPQCRRLGDIWFLPEGNAPDEAWFHALSLVQSLGLLKLEMVLGPRWYAPALKNLYLEHKLTLGKEPDWIEDCDERVQGQIRCDVLIEEIDHPLYLGELAFTGLHCLIDYNGGLVRAVAENLNFWRLQSISQLAYLQAPGVHGGYAMFDLGRYPHNRMVHSLDVYVIAALLAEACGLNERDTLHLEVAALVHDILTPAGGDTTKRINVTMFDEDLNFRSLYRQDGWKRLRRLYDLSEDLLEEIILDRGVLGRLKDIADKIAYVARDTSNFLSRKPRHLVDGYSIDPDTVLGIVTRNPFVCGLWDSARIVDGSVVMSNIDGLSDFLTLRALMFRALYYNPYSRFLEDALAKMAIEYLLKEEIFTKADLLAMTDLDLMRALESKVIGVPNFFTMLGNTCDPKIQVFATEREALEEECHIDRDRISCVVKARSLTTNGIKSFPVVEDGVVKTFAEVRPEVVRQIEKIMEDQTPIRLYSFSTKHLELPAQFIRKQKTERRRRLKVFAR